MGFIGEVVGDGQNRRKMDSKEMKYGKRASYCLLSKYAWFRFFQPSGAKICLKHQMSFLGVLEYWGKSDSWFIF